MNYLNKKETADIKKIDALNQITSKERFNAEVFECIKKVSTNATANKWARLIAIRQCEVFGCHVESPTGFQWIHLKNMSEVFRAVVYNEFFADIPLILTKEKANDLIIRYESAFHYMRKKGLR